MTVATMLSMRNNFELNDVMGFTVELASDLFHIIECEIASTRKSLLINRKYQVAVVVFAEVLAVPAVILRT